MIYQDHNFSNPSCNRLDIPKTVKKSPGFTKLRSQNLKIKFLVVHDVIWKYYIINFIIENKANKGFPESFDDNILISINLSSFELSVNNLVDVLRYTAIQWKRQKKRSVILIIYGLKKTTVIFVSVLIHLK